MESLDQCQHLEVRKKVRNVFCDEPGLSDHKALQNIAYSSIFFRFRLDFLAFCARISYFKFLEFKEFNKTIIVLLKRLLDTRLVIANSGLCASLAIYHLTSNARSWNNC